MQIRKSVALALREAHKQKNSVVVLSSNTASFQGSEVMDPTEFAELLKDVLLEDLVQNPTHQFSCIFIAVQSFQQCEKLLRQVVGQESSFSGRRRSISRSTWGRKDERGFA